MLEQKGFVAAARSIFDHCKEFIGTTGGYVALLSETGEENEVLFLEGGGMPCDVNPVASHAHPGVAFRVIQG